MVFNALPSIVYCLPLMCAVAVSYYILYVSYHVFVQPYINLSSFIHTYSSLKVIRDRLSHYSFRHNYMRVCMVGFRQRAEEHLLEISRSRPECRLPEVPAPHLLMPDVSQLARDVRAPALADDDVMHVDQSDSSDTDTAPLPTQRRRTMPPPRQKQQEQQPKKRTTRAPPPAHSQR